MRRLLCIYILLPDHNSTGGERERKAEREREKGRERERQRGRERERQRGREREAERGRGRKREAKAGEGEIKRQKYERRWGWLKYCINGRFKM